MEETAQQIRVEDFIVNSYVALDLETTGLDAKKDRIIEIGAVKVIDGQIKEEFSSLINPRKLLEPRIVGITNITDEMLLEAPGMEEKIEEILDFCSGFPVLGHHIIFDYSFLKRFAVNSGLEFEKKGIDTLSICRGCMPAETKKNLTDASRYFGVVQETAHRALSDARTAHLLYQALKERYGNVVPKFFMPKPLIYKVKKEQPATKKQKEVLRDLIKYHKINLTVQIDYLTRNEASRMADKIMFQYGRIKRGEKNV